MDVAAWLQGLGLERYVPAFRDNEIDWEVLPKLTSEDLREIGVTAIGHRRKLLDAIAALGAAVPAAAVTAAATRCTGTNRCRAPAADGDVLRSGRLDRAVDAARSRGFARGHRRLSPRASPRRSPRSTALSPNTWATACWSISATRRRMRTMPSGRCGRGWASSTLSARLDVKSVKLQARVGIATGLVVVGDLIGEGSAQEQSVVGETPNLAARLQALAEPDAVVIAAGTRRLVGDLFEYRDLGAVEVKGIAAPVPAWQVLRQSVVASRFEALRGPALTPLVGRDEEIELLLRRWARAKEGDGQVVLISGEPGIGKSRIAAALQERLRAEPHITPALFLLAAPSRQRALPVHRPPRTGRRDSRATILPEAQAGRSSRPCWQSAQTPDEDVRAPRRSARPADRRAPSAPTVTPQRKRERTLER